VEVTEVIGQQASVIELRVAKEDMEKLLGSRAEQPKPSAPF